MCKKAHAGCQGCPDNDEWRSSSVAEKDGGALLDDDTFPFQLPRLPVVIADPPPATLSGGQPQTDPLDWCGHLTD